MSGCTASELNDQDTHSNDIFTASKLNDPNTYGIHNYMILIASKFNDQKTHAIDICIVSKLISNEHMVLIFV